MKRTKLFKNLIDILYFFLCFGLLGVLFLAPTGFATISMENKDVEYWDVFSWLFFIFSMISYITMLIGIKHLKNAAKYMLDQNKFHPKIAIFLKKSGQYLIFSSLMGYAMFVMLFIKKMVFDSKFEVILDNNGLLQIFITIIGIFFILQSDVLNKAATYKEENDLTI